MQGKEGQRLEESGEERVDESGIGGGKLFSFNI